MAPNESILQSTKHLLGLEPDYEVFDAGIINHVNSAFFNLNQLGVGPDEVFTINGSDEVWTDFDADVNRVIAVKSFVYYKARLAFDPPQTSYAIKAIEDQIQELTWRLNVQVEP